MVIFIILLMLVSVIVLIRYFSNRQKRQLHFINTFTFPTTIAVKLKHAYPHLTEHDITQVQNALKQYFIVCHKAGGKMVAMPSQVVDVAWHEFILFTREYKVFCEKALGRFLHHTPAEAMKKPTHAQQSIKRAWRLACREQGINPKSPLSLPLLFAIDTNLKIPNGFTYNLNCKDANSPNKYNGQCATHIGCSGFSCSGSSATDSGCSSSCGGGCSS